MKKIISTTVGLFLALVSVAYAQNISFPVAELGNCTDKASCKVYCDTAGHEDSCLSFAQKQGLMSSSEVQQAKKFVGETGPGGCKGSECKTYCDNADHTSACIDFATKKGFISSDEAERAKKFQKATETGGPGGCTREGCKQYCESRDHQDECFAFAQKNGLVPPEEIARHEQGQKILDKIKTSGGPGGCTAEGECRSYCSNSTHVEECVAFATANGGMTSDEARSKLKEFSKESRDFNQNQQNQNQNQQGQQNPNGTSGFPENDRGNSSFHGTGPDEAQMMERFKKFEEQFKNSQKEMPQGAPMRGSPSPDAMKMMTPEMQQQMQKNMQNMPAGTQMPTNGQMPAGTQMPANGQMPNGTQMPSGTSQQMPSGMQMTPEMQRQMQTNMQNMPAGSQQMPAGMQMTPAMQQQMQNMPQGMQGMPAPGGSMPSMPSGGSMPSMPSGGMPSGGSMPSMPSGGGGGGMMMSGPHSMNIGTNLKASSFDAIRYFIIEKR